MKLKGIILISLFIILTSLWTFNVVFNALTGSKFFDLSKFITTKQIATDLTKSKSLNLEKCSDKQAINFQDTADEHLTRLEDYQDLCGSFLTDSMMIFTDMPKDNQIAQKKAKEMSIKLKEFNKYKVQPIVIVEPITQWGLIDFTEFDSGFYDSWIKTYFLTLQKEGITDQMMGTWVPFPEANLPYWNHASATPADFSRIVNKYLKFLKTYFPEAKGSILLNSATYETDDFDWANGEYVSLSQYVSGLDKKYIDSFGIQGFPWSPPATSKDAAAIFNAREFLNEDLISEAADLLGTKNIWINTGTFSQKYTLDPEQTITITPEVRLDVLNSILSQAVKLKQKKYNVSINIFAQDKSETAEATNWSYQGIYKNVFVNFAARANSENIILTIFDRENQ